MLADELALLEKDAERFLTTGVLNSQEIEGRATPAQHVLFSEVGKTNQVANDGKRKMGREIRHHIEVTLFDEPVDEIFRQGFDQRPYLF
ncbi:hypothetical protein QU42_00820 [Bradyrhizobium sp. UASWS1016]|nr:hypothetical protein QU42_00820 [Bradyrhizobium sp. UASWS1016]